MHGSSRCFTSVLLTALICAATPAWPQQKIDFAIHYPERSAATATFKWWIAEVDKATQGRVKFVPHYAAALVTANETLKAVRDGAVPAGSVHAAALSGQMPAFAYLEAIGGMPVERAQYLEAVRALRPVLERQFHAQGKGVEYLWSESLGELIVLCRNRHMKTPADWKGLKVRTAGRWQAEQLRAMGVSTVAMDVSEQYIALQNRTIDCALLVAGLASALKVHEVAPKVTLLRMSVNFNSFIMNKEVYDKISAADRAVMTRLAVEAEPRASASLAKDEEDARNLMKSQKADIYAITDAERSELRKGITPAYAKMASEGGAAGKEIGDILKRYW